MTRAANFLDRRSPLVLVGSGIAVTLIIGALDYLASPELVLFVFYLIPIAVVTWFAGRRAGVAVMFAAFLIWFFASSQFRHPYSTQFLAVWNTIIPFLFFLLTVMLFSGLKVSHQQLRAREEELLHDALTGLPNGTLFMDRLKQVIQRSKRSGRHGHAVLFLDLDRFKEINDTLGHAFGDYVLMTTARRLQGCVREVDTVARLGGDEFVILLDNVENEGGVVHVAQRILGELDAPIVFSGHEVLANASIGIAPGGARYELGEDLLRDADTALYHAKLAGKGRYEIFEASMQRRTMPNLR